MTKEINEEFVAALAVQMKTLLETGDVASYVESNINYEADVERNSERNKSLKGLFPHSNLALDATDSVFSGFWDWVESSVDVQAIRKAICMVVDEVRKLIDAKAELKKLIKAGLMAVAAAGIFINPIVGTIVVGILTAMILKGVEAVCPV